METLDFGAIGNLSPDALLHHPGIIGAVAEHAATALLLTDIHDHCIYMNPAAEQMTGFRFAELKGQALHRTLHYKQPGSPVHQTCRCAVYQAIKKKTALRNQEEVLIRKNKTACRVQYSITPIFDAQQVVAFLYEIQDVHAKPLQEQALKNLEELIDTTSLLVTAWDSSARLTYASRAWLEYTGVPWEQFRKTGLMEHFHPDIREAAVAEWRNAFAQRRCFSGEYLVRSVSGEYRWFYFVAAPRFTAEGEFLGFYATAFDIHDRKLAETPRPESEIHFKRLFNNSLVGLFFWEFSGDITEANDSFLDLLGYTRQEFEEKGLNWRSITPPELIYLDQEALRHLQVASSTEPYEKQFIHRDGHPIDVLVQASLLGDGLNQGLMVVRELKQHRKKRSKQPLQESEQWSRAVADTTPILLWTADPDGHCTYVNRAWEEFTGKTEAELLGSGWLKVFHKQDFKWRIEAGKEPHRFQKEVRLRHQDGRYRWAVLSATPKFNKRGDCTGYTGAIVDINAQKEASLELERSANYFREITEHSLLMLWLSDEKGYVTFVSQGLANFCGLDKEELLGHQWLKCIHPDDREVCFFKYQSQTPTREEERIRHRDGKYRWVLIVTHPRYDAKGNFIGFIGLMTDIEDRKQMEFALKNSEAHFRRLLDASPLMLWMTNANQEVYFLSQGLADYAGTNKDAFMNSGWQFVLHPDDAEHYKNTVQTHHANHTPFREEVRHIYRDGTYRWVFVTGHPMFGPSGEFIGFFGTITDIEDRKRIELALKKSEEYFRYIVDTSPVMLWIGSQEGYEFVSAGLSEYFGLPKEAFNEMSWLDMFHPDDQEALRLAYLKGYETQEPYTIEARARTKDGTYRWILNSGRPRFDADGKFAGLIGLIMDIHDRKEAILSLQRSEEYFRYIVDTSPVMLWMCSADGDNEFVSTSLAEYFGLPKKAFTGLRWMELIHPDDRKAFVEQYEKTRDTQQPYAIEARAKVASGEYRWILSSARPRFDTDGKFTGLIGLILDIHDQKESILALQRSEEYFRYIVDIAPVMLWMINTQGEVTFVSKGIADYFGQPKEAFYNQDWLQGIHPDDRDNFLASTKKNFKKRKAYAQEYRVKNKHGIYRWVLDSAQPRYSPQGQFEGFIGTITDITAKKEAELMIRESEEQFRMMADAAPAKLWMSDAQSKIVYASKGLLDFLGVSLEEFIQHEWSAAIHPEDLNWFLRKRQKHIRKREPYETELRVRNAQGEYRWIISAAQPRYTPTGEYAGYVGSVVDITQRKLTLLELQESEARFRLMADAAPVHIWTANRNGKTEYFNKQLLDFLKLSLEEAQAGKYMDRVHPDEQEKLFEVINSITKTPHPFQMEIRLYSPSLGEYRWLHSQAVPRYTPDGTFFGFIGSSIDITELKRAQDKISNYAKRLEQSNRELEQFATIASHDLQAPLRKIAMFSTYIQENAYDILPDDSKDYFDRILKSVDKMQHLLNDLLDLSRINRKGQPFRPVDLNEIVDEVLSDLQFSIADTQGQVYVDSLCTVDADPLQMHQLFQNLVSNALKFHKPGEHPIVRVFKEGESDHICHLVVEDNGIGFPEEQAERIFEPFVRLQGAESYEGSGMGLTICQKIVERHGGSITAASRPGEGARISVSLPKGHPSLEKVPAPP